MEIDDFANQLIELKKKERAQKIWELFLVKLPYMDENNFISYEEMLNMTEQSETKEGTTTNGFYIDQVFI